MSATNARVTCSLPCGNPNASRTDERPVQLTRTDGHETRTDEHVDNPGFRDPGKIRVDLPSSVCCAWRKGLVSGLTLLESPGPNPDPDLAYSCISVSLGRFCRQPSLPYSTIPVPYTGGIDTARLASP